MVFSERLLRLPYSWAWNLAHRYFSPPRLAFYCEEMIDYFSFQPVREALGPLPVIAGNSHIRKTLAGIGVPTLRYPAFPRAVVMCRHATHKFPCHSIIRIGMRHGPYHFKRMTKAENYNQFDLYLFSSQADLKAAEEIGVTVGKAVGFPRLDPLFQGAESLKLVHRRRSRLKLDPEKATLLFTATWPKSGMSAVHLWFNRLDELSARYNVLATVHPWTDKHIQEVIGSTSGVRLITSSNLLPYIALADVCLGDTSSLLAECSALQKPIVTFKTSKARRSMEEIDQLIGQISISIETFDEVRAAVKRCLENPDLMREGQLKANAIMFDALDGNAGQRAAREIRNLLELHNIWL